MFKQKLYLLLSVVCVMGLEVFRRENSSTVEPQQQQKQRQQPQQQQRQQPQQQAQTMEPTTTFAKTRFPRVRIKY